MRVKNNKAMSISIVLLVILTFILVTLSIGYFIISQNKSSTTLTVPSALDSVYSDAIFFNFYLDNVFDKASKDFQFKNGKAKFIEKLKEEIDKTTFYSYYGNTIHYSSIGEDNVELSENKLALNLDITITYEFNDKKSIGTEYKYKQRFEKIL